MKEPVRLAKRVTNLGVETAFLVAAKAAAHAAKGNKVYPFHLGDMNLPTPANIVEAAYRAMRDGKNGYTPNAGILPLREALACEINATRKTSYSPENISVQPGGKPVISKFILALMNPGDEVLYPNPGFPIYESQIRFHGGIPVPYTVIPDREHFTFDLDGLEEAVSERTRLLIINDLHNPTGAEMSAEQRHRISEIAVKHNLLVLLDEAYFDVRYTGRSASLVSEPGMVERSLILYTFSKKYAMTGWRVGAAIGPKDIIEIMNKLNVNDESCTSHSNQYAAIEALQGEQSAARQLLRILQKRRDRAVELLNTIQGVSCSLPKTTFYLYPDVSEALIQRGFSGYEDFLDTVLQHTGVALCGRPHFGACLAGESRYHLRLAYSGIDLADLEEGLTRFKSFLES
ncbi:MAG: aspartate aminotransferase [Deltaproteobacteria bacterium]|nr:MAG: aspartate aminotransferase [Deltaproteobacteria bacterium]